jgi:hypothetical protein
VEQKTHLYNARLAKVKWFVERFGARELLLKPLRTLFAPMIIPTLPKKTFSFRGQDLPYLYHRYNMTWASERCVEVPIVRSFMTQHNAAATLEVGNVLSHYGPISHDVLDKFEKGERVINEDILQFKPTTRYQLIVSISTFEHIGFDDEAEGSSADKILAAVNACRGLLEARGRVVITAPIGYNPELDDLLRRNALGAKESYLKMYARLDWRECSKEEALRCKYKNPFPYANAIVVAEFENTQVV